MRDTFFREKKKIKKSRSGDPQESAEVYTGKWSYFKLLLFLKDTTTPRVTDGNILDSEDENYNVDDDDNIAEHIENDDFNSNNSIDVLNTSNLLMHSNTETLTPSTSTGKRSSESEYSQPRMRKNQKLKMINI